MCYICLPYAASTSYEAILLEKIGLLTFWCVREDEFLSRIEVIIIIQKGSQKTMILITHSEPLQRTFSKNM